MRQQLQLQQAIGQVTVTGTIFDAVTKQPLFGATVTLLDENNNPVSDPTTLNEGSNTFTVWTDTPDTRRVGIAKDGYAPTVMEFTYFQINDQVFLQHIDTRTDIKKYWWVALIALPILMRRKKQVGALSDEHIKWVLYGVGGLFAYKFIRDLLARFGLVEGQGSTATDQQIADPNSAWKPGYWQQFSTFNYPITTEQATDYSETIHGAFGILQDDFNAVLSVFSNMHTKANVSFLSYVFNNKYNEDLLSFLKDGGGLMPWDGLSDAHLKQLTDLVANLPNN